jgi:acetyl-CoA carboxylase beta subunit
MVDIKGEKCSRCKVRMLRYDYETNGWYCYSCDAETSPETRHYAKGVLDEQRRILNILKENIKCSPCMIMVDTVKKIERGR